MKMIIQTNNLESTLALGQAIGAVLGGGEVIELQSDLGGGKTALTKGIAAGMGSKDTVQSPTFTISRIYRCHNNLELHHFDFYRLQDAGVMAAELSESLSDEQVVVVIEWSDIVANLLPEQHIRIALLPTTETGRQITLEIPDKMTGLCQAVSQFKEAQA